MLNTLGGLEFGDNSGLSHCNFQKEVRQWPAGVIIQVRSENKRPVPDPSLQSLTKLHLCLSLKHFRP